MFAPLATALVLSIFGLPPKEPGDPKPKPQENPTEELTHQVATSRVEEVQDDRLVLHRAGAPLEIRVEPQTPVYLGRRTGTLHDLRPGDEVRVSYDAKKGPPRANWIEVVPKHSRRSP